MCEKHGRVRCELTAIFNGLFERPLMNAERRPNGRNNLLASEPHYQPGKNPAITPKTIRSIDLSYLFF